jgi:peptide/nickel transport system substrate-binding protein
MLLGQSLLGLWLLAMPPADTLVVGTLADPVHLEPHRATDLVGAEIVASVCETLVRQRAGSMRPEAALATSWATADQRVWTFTLREEVRFHDGTLFDADAVVGNFEHLRRERAFEGRAVRIGPHAVQIVLDRPNAALLATLSQPFFGLQSPRQLGVAASQTPVGTGPFRVSATRPGLVELAAFPGYWRGAPRLAKVQFRRFPSERALALALETGEADVSSAVDQGHVALLRSRDDISLDSRTGLNLAYLALNNERPPFDDSRVRQAVARAVDRPAIIRDALAGHGEPASTPLPPSVIGPDVRTREIVRDPDAARRLLARASHEAGFETTLAYPDAPRPYLPAPRRVAELIRSALAEVGIAVRLREAVSWAEHVRLTSGGDFDMALLGWQADTLDPNDFLTVLLDSGTIGDTNRSRFRNEAMDRLLKRARMESAPGTRLSLYREVQELFQKEMPFVPLYHASVFTARRREVRGLIIGPTGLMRFEKAWKAP